jgi:hypothetical protein
MIRVPKELTGIVLGLGVVAGKPKGTKLRLGKVLYLGDIGKPCLLIPLIKSPLFLSCNIAGIIQGSLTNHLGINDVSSFISCQPLVQTITARLVSLSMGTGHTCEEN